MILIMIMMIIRSTSSHSMVNIHLKSSGTPMHDEYV